MKGNNVEIILGSESDLKFVGDPRVMAAKNAMKKAGITVNVLVISAHRHPDLLRKTLKRLMEEDGVDIFVCAAGMAAALPGAVAAEIDFQRPVIGVPLPSPGFESCMDSLLSMVRMPPGCPVLIADNMLNGILAAWQIVDREKAEGYIVSQMKEPKLSVGDDELTAAYEKSIAGK